MNKKQEIFMCAIGGDIERFLAFAKADPEISLTPIEEINKQIEYIKMRIAEDYYRDENNLSLNEKHPETLSEEDIKEIAIAFIAHNTSYERHMNKIPHKLTILTYESNITHG